MHKIATIFIFALMGVLLPTTAHADATTSFSIRIAAPHCANDGTSDTIARVVILNGSGTVTYRTYMMLVPSGAITDVTAKRRLNNYRTVLKFRIPQDSMTLIGVYSGDLTLISGALPPLAYCSPDGGTTE